VAHPPNATCVCLVTPLSPAAGYVEMDTDLNIRKADMWAGLVLGWPSTMLVNQKLHK